jgi:hypothetical protein
MLKIELTNSIKKDLKKYKHQKGVILELQEIIELLGCVPKPFFYRFSSSFEPLFDLNDKGYIT